jgi:hypothetical protein
MPSVAASRSDGMRRSLSVSVAVPRADQSRTDVITLAVPSLTFRALFDVTERERMCTEGDLSDLGRVGYNLGEVSAEEVFKGAKCHGQLCAQPLGDNQGIDIYADQLVVSASVVKVPIALEAGIAIAGGRLDPRERITLTAADRSPGPGRIFPLPGRCRRIHPRLGCRDAYHQQQSRDRYIATDCGIGAVTTASVSPPTRPSVRCANAAAWRVPAAG